MNRQEFMRRLEQLLEGIPEEEKREAIAYYTSYFEDAGEENEEKIIRELESPEKVAATIRADFPGCNNSETASSGNQQNYNGASQSMGQQNYNGTIQREDNTTRNILLIILLVLTSPIWGGILVAIGGTLAGIIGGLFGIAVGCVIGGIAVAGVAITILVTGVISLGFISMAAGLLMLAIGLCAAGLLVLVCGKFLPWFAKGIAKLWQSLFKKKGALAHEKSIKNYFWYCIRLLFFRLRGIRNWNCNRWNHAGICRGSEK